MNLIIDTGNSGTKLALYKDSVMMASSRCKRLTEKEIKNFTGKFPADRIIISSVIEIPGFLTGFARSINSELMVLTAAARLPFSIAYKTPDTLGPDRIAAIAGAYEKYPGSRSLIIDAGSAITFDFLNLNVYEGGNISPGIDMRFRALHKFTGRLPLVTRPDSFKSPGLTTEEAIGAGVVTGIVYEINEYIRTFEEKHKDLKVIMTGGDGLFLRGKINAKFYYHPEIVMDGLNYILEYNA